MAEEINEKGFFQLNIHFRAGISFRVFLRADFSNINLRKKLMSMVATCLKSEADGNHKKLDSLLERQDWLDNLRKVMVLIILYFKKIESKIVTSLIILLQTLLFKVTITIISQHLKLTK